MQTVIAQTYYPKISSQSEKNLKIIKVERNPTNTIIEFEYIRTEPDAIYILLNPPNTSDAYFIQSNGIKFSLISTEGIGNKDGVTPAYPNKSVKFSAIFEPLPKSIKKFDLIEGTNGTWHFYGVEPPWLPHDFIVWLYFQTTIFIEPRDTIAREPRAFLSDSGVSISQTNRFPISLADWLIDSFHQGSKPPLKLS